MSRSGKKSQRVAARGAASLSSDSEPAGCCVCGSTEFRHLLWSYQFGPGREPLRYERCRGCTAIREDPSGYAGRSFDPETPLDDLTEEQRHDFQRLYGESIQVVQDDGELYELYEFHDSDDMVDDLFERVREQVEGSQESFRYLEVGCADGFLLERVAAALDATVAVGVEPSPVSVKQAHSRGLDVRRGTMDDVDLSDVAPFDVAVVLGNLMLHPDPVLTLSQIAGVLKPGGLIVADVKDSGCLSRQIAILVSAIGLDRFSPVRSYVARNFTNLRHGFEPKHLAAIAQGAGLTLMRSKPVPPRALAFSNDHAGSNGIIGLVWRLSQRVDDWRGRSAWLQFTLVRKGGVGSGALN